MKCHRKLAFRTIGGSESPINTGTSTDSLKRLLLRCAKGAGFNMKRLILIIAIIVAGFWGQPASAQGLLGGLLSTVTNTLSSLTAPPQGVIVRTNLGLARLKSTCASQGCTVSASLDGNVGQLFLVTPVQGLLPNLLANLLRTVTGILDAEVDQVATLPSVVASQASNSASQTITATPPSGLYDQTPVNYYGAQAWHGYVTQPAVQIIHIPQVQNTFHVTGAGIVADIDTGVDPNHPALQGVLLPGYDFTRNQPGGSELNDLSTTPSSSCNGCTAGAVNQSTVAMLEQSTVAMLDGNQQYQAFGHGTMVVGIIHLAAPTAQIMPLKAFGPSGTGNLSNILKAIYYGVQNNAKVLNMSFDLTSSSQELSTAIQYASNNNVITVASSGNDGKMELVYPAALQPQGVMGVASTSNSDQRSTFSNYGNRIVWVAAPGEAIVTTYPFATYAAGWGTSFSAPFVSGTAALLVNVQPNCSPLLASIALTQSQPVGPNMGNGRLDTLRAVLAMGPVLNLLQ
jgi:subtilisin family serine protease